MKVTGPTGVFNEMAVHGSTSDTGISESPDGQHRLAFYIPNLSMGGAEQVTVSIVNGLADRGHDIDLLISDPSGELRSEIHDDVNVVVFGNVRLPIAGIGAHVRDIARYIRQTEPAIIIPQMLHASVVCLVASLLVAADTRIVPTAHCSLERAPPESLKSRIVRALAPRLYSTADHVIAVSEGVANDVAETLSVPPDRISVLNNPVDIEAVHERGTESSDHPWLEEPDLDVILFVGRLADQKDLKTWLRTFERVHKQAPATRGIVAGTGPRRDSLKRLAADRGLSDLVSFPGFVDNPYAFMSRASVFLLTSQYEGLPTVLIEALACGCPVVATDCPSGPREILDGGQYGRLVPVNAEGELADAVLSTISDPPPAQLLRARANRYKPKRILDKYERFITSQISQ